MKYIDHVLCFLSNLKKGRKLILILWVLFFACEEPVKPTTLLIGSYTSEKNPFGIHKVEVNFETLTAKVYPLDSTYKNISYIIRGKDKKSFFGVSETSNYKNANQGSLVHFHFMNNHIKRLSEKGTRGGTPCHLTYQKRYEKVFAANYSGGSVSEFNLEDTTLKFNSQVKHFNTGLDTLRQTKSHLHFVKGSPWSKNILYGVDLGGDYIYTYQTNQNLKCLDSLKLPIGSGSRFLDFHPSKKWIYCVNELNPSISLVALDEFGDLHYEAGFNLYNKNIVNYPAHVQVHPNGKFLYVSLRGENSIVMFNINPKNGYLEYQKTFSTKGNWPRHFILSEDSNHLIVANQKSDNVLFFEIDSKTGSLTELPISCSVPSPVCIVEPLL